MKQETSADVSDLEKPAEIIDPDCERVAVNEEMCELFGYTKSELMGMSLWESNINDKAEHGRLFQQVLNGETCEAEVEIELADGSPVRVTAGLEPVELAGETHMKSVVTDVEEVENVGASKKPDASVFEDISSTELDEIVQNIRVEAPEGTMNLGMIMLDLAAGHNEVEQFKKGALSLHQAIDERLQEEQKRNPDSIECEVLEEVKRSAFGLYLRIQRGDQELHGERDGRYSGYFN